MDSQKRNESRDRLREEALARRVGEALDQLAHRHAGECPDAELIAAYHEKSLQADEIPRWEGHFAICGRCRKILAVLAASVETPLAEKEVAHLGELIAAARAPSEVTVRPIEAIRENRLAWRTRWLAPALGVAAVLTVWFAMRPPWRTANQNPSETLIAQAPKSETPPSTEPRAMEQFSKVTPKKTPETNAEFLKDRPATQAQSPNAPTDSFARNRLDGGRVIGGVAPSASGAEKPLQDERKDKAESKSVPASGAFDGAFGTAAPGLRPPAPPPPKPALVLPREAQVQTAENGPKVTAPPTATTQSDVVPEAAPSVSTAAEPVGGGADNAPARSKQALAAPGGPGDTTAASADAIQPLTGRNLKSFSQLAKTEGNATLIRTPSESTLWRVGKGGGIERSTDAGRSWIVQTSPSQEEWLAGAAFSDTVCWLVGRNGAIARTTDGGRWKKIAPPRVAADSSGKLPDWTSLTAASAQAATITASDQRRYSTQDGGKTWKAQ